MEILGSTIIIDSREKREYQFKNSTTKKLDAGDYSLENYEHRIAIERKSLDDYIGTMLRSKDRFAAELAKLRTYDFAAIIIECNMHDITSGNYKSAIKPDALRGIIANSMVWFRPVQVIIAGDRPNAMLMTCELLKLAKEYCDYKDRKEAVLEAINAERN